MSNFRGITLLSHISKLFTSVLNNRLLKWNTETYFSTDAHFVQFGLKPGYGTVDAIVALKSLIDRTLASKERLYRCPLFIDYSKAFGNVSYGKLWLKLIPRTL